MATFRSLRLFYPIDQRRSGSDSGRTWDSWKIQKQIPLVERRLRLLCSLLFGVSLMLILYFYSKKLSMDS